MRIWLDLPDDLIEQLAQKGQDLSRSALEALAIDAYRMNRITSHQLCQLLEIPSRFELDGFLNHHGVPPWNAKSAKAAKKYCLSLRPLRPLRSIVTFAPERAGHEIRRSVPNASGT